MLDRMKFRITVKLKFIPTIKIALDGWVFTDLVGWIDGPVRVITRSKTYIKFGFIKFGVSALYNVGMYRNGIHFIVDISSSGESILTSYPAIVKNSTFMIYMDLSEELMNHYVYSEHNSSSIKALLDGKTTPNEEQLDFSKSVNWIAGYGEKGGIMARIFVPEDWTHILRTFYLNEDLEKSVNPEESKGELGVGWKIAGSENIFTDKGTLVVYLYYFEPDFKPPMEKDILNIHDNPVKVSIIKR